MTMTKPMKWLLAAIFSLVLALIYIPLLIILVNSFNTSLTFTWPPPGFTLEWWVKAFDNEGVRSALLTSVLVATAATLIALVLGTLVSFALSGTKFFGHNTISLLVVLPIALPGIVTGLALNTMFTSFLGGLTFFTLVVAHATFCIVVVFNNVSARLRRLGGDIVEASMDLGASRAFTFRHVVFPNMRAALVAGALLAFGSILRRDHRDDVHRRSGSPDTSPVDLQQPLPAPTGTHRERRGRRPGRHLDHSDLPGTTTLRRRSAQRRLTNAESVHFAVRKAPTVHSPVTFAAHRREDHR